MNDASPRRPAPHGKIAARRAAIARRRRRRQVTVATVVIGLLAVGAGAVLLPELGGRAITEIRVPGLAEDRRDEVLGAAGLPLGERLSRATLEAAQERVNAITWVAQATVRRAEPTRIDIDVVAREPFAVVEVDEAAWKLDAEGVVLGGGQGEDLVRVLAPNSVIPGPGVGTSDAAVMNALAFAADWPATLMDRTEVFEARSATSLRLSYRVGEDHEVWVQVGRAEDVVRKGEVLLTLLEQAAGQLEAGAVAEIDVRAPVNPVLVPRASNLPEPALASDLRWSPPVRLDGGNSLTIQTARLTVPGRG